MKGFLAFLLFRAAHSAECARDGSKTCGDAQLSGSLFLQLSGSPDKKVHAAEPEMVSQMEPNMVKSQMGPDSVGGDDVDGGLAPPSPPNDAFYPPSFGDIVVGDLVWSDEFDDPTGTGMVNSSKWRWDSGTQLPPSLHPANSELQAYTDRTSNSYLEDGKLKIIAKCENFESRSFTSARLHTEASATFGPGHRMEVKASLPTGRGAWPAVWMLPTDEVYGAWPNSGEIDIVEAVGCTQSKVYGTVHTDAYNHMKNTQKGNDLPIDYGSWHTYTLDWLDSEIRWYVDGQHYHTFAPDTSHYSRWPFSEKFYLILNVAVGGSWGGYCLNGQEPSCSSWDEFGQEQVMEVDYVRVNQLWESSTG